MTVPTILPIDHPLLRKTARPVRRFGPSLRQMIDDMFETLEATGGVGLAAPQVGKSIQLLVAAFEEQRVALCNPVITAKEGELIGAEGCLSLPGFVGMNIRRAAHIEVEALDPQGTPVAVSAEGMFARILQHEIDHLHGILFLDHLEDPHDLRPIPSDESEEVEVAEPVTSG